MAWFRKKNDWQDPLTAGAQPGSPQPVPALSSPAPSSPATSGPVAAGPTVAGSAGGDSGIELLAVGDSKIKVIKILHDELGLELAAAKNLVDSSPVPVPGLSSTVADRLAAELMKAGATVRILQPSGAPAAVAPAATTSAPAVTSGLASVRLDAVGDTKIAVIKCFVDRLGLPLKAAKSMVDAAPGVLPIELTPQAADDFAAALTALGATAVVVPASL